MLISWTSVEDCFKTLFLWMGMNVFHQARPFLWVLYWRGEIKWEDKSQFRVCQSVRARGFWSLPIRAWDGDEGIIFFVENCGNGDNLGLVLSTANINMNEWVLRGNLFFNFEKMFLFDLILKYLFIIFILFKVTLFADLS